jgi:hypothetical protein
MKPSLWGEECTVERLKMLGRDRMKKTEAWEIQILTTKGE